MPLKNVSSSTGILECEVIFEERLHFTSFLYPGYSRILLISDAYTRLPSTTA